MHYFYVLYSLKDDKLYKGYTSELGTRFQRHHNGATASTKHRRPLVLIYVEIFESATKARERERWSKTKEGGPDLKLLLREKEILNQNNKLYLR